MSEPGTAIITAGGSGMGAEAARRLADDGFGWRFCRRPDGARRPRRNWADSESGSNRSTEDLQRLVDGAVERWGRIDVLVNSAGHGPKGDILHITDDEWHTGMEVYLLNVIRPVRMATPVMERQGAGTIVNISTFAAFEPDPLFPTSGVFRAGLAAFTKLFADRYAASNIRMNNVLPGFIDSLPEKDERRERVSMGRYGTAREVADVIAFLASDGAAYVTGQNLRVDGGLTRAV